MENIARAIHGGETTDIGDEEFGDGAHVDRFAGTSHWVNVRRCITLSLLFSSLGCTSQNELLRDYAVGLEAQRAARYSDAESAYARVLSAQPNFQGVHNNLAVLAVDSGDKARALKEIERELGAHPKGEAARTNHVILLLQGSGRDAARSAAEALVATGPKTPLSLLLLGLAHAEGGDTARSLAAFEEVITSGGDDLVAVALNARAHLRYRAGDYALARADFAEVGQRRRDAVAAHAEAICALKLGDAVGGKAAWERASTLDAAAEPVHLLGLWVALHDRDLPSVESRSAALMKSPTAARPARRLRAVARIELGDPSGATSDLEALMEERPEADIAFNLGLSYVALGRLSEAEAAFTEASELPDAPASALKNRDAIATLMGAPR